MKTLAILLFAASVVPHAHGADSKTNLELQVTYGDRVSRFTVKDRQVDFYSTDGGVVKQGKKKLSVSQQTELKTFLADLKPVEKISEDCTRFKIVLKNGSKTETACLNQDTGLVELANTLARLF